MRLNILILAVGVFGRITLCADNSTIPADHPERLARGLEQFQKEVRATLVENCLKCHGGEKVKGGLDISSRERLLKGGDHGLAVVPFRPEESRLLKLIRHAEEPYMPEKKERLSSDKIEQIAAWIENGAPYDKPLVETKSLARDRSVVTEEDRNWWAFRPLSQKLPLAVENAGDHYPSMIDRFVVAKASEHGLKLAPRADKRALVRRAWFDLIGLPPPPEEVVAFLKDESAEAWSHLIDRLLASSQYGERWARHWLDVARFAESSGFEHDYDREGAYFYRDFVIKALNSDLPYDRFLAWQVSGDEFEPNNPLALSATGFLGAGVFPTQITANEVERTRYDAMDDMLSTTTSAFLGLTVGCARCHDHKYDPIPTRDYYQMLSAFTTTVRSVIDLDVDPEKTRGLVAEWEKEQQRLDQDVARYERSLATPFDTWLKNSPKLENHASWAIIETSNIVSKAGATFRKLDDGSYIVEGKNGDVDDYTITTRLPSTRLTGLRLEALADASLVKGGPGRADNGNFALSKLRVFLSSPNDPAPHEVKLINPKADFEQNQSNLAITASLDDDPSTGWAIDPQFGKDHTAVFTFAEPIEAAAGSTLAVKIEFHVNTKHNIGRMRLATTSDPVPSLQGEVIPPRIAELLEGLAKPSQFSLNESDHRLLFDWWKQREAGWKAVAAKGEEHHKKKPDGKNKVLVCAEGYTPLRMHTQGADFFNETYILKRGSTDLKDGVANESFLQVLMRPGDKAEQWRWSAPEGAKFSGRRRSLANWMTDTKSGAGALAARVAVNRLWQHHFGRGMVATPNDFGKAGALPSDPELLDWLATELIRSGWSIKAMHRLLMTSETYMQSTATDEAKEKADPNNDLFVRRIPRRLEGENIRDSMLSVAGVLDKTMFGPGTKDEQSKRRSIYFTMKRSQLIGSMVVFDQPEPLVSQGVRPTTTVAPQALLLMNGPQVRDWANAFAKRVMAETSVHADSIATVNRAWLLALSRSPSEIERSAAQTFLQKEGASYEADGKSDSQLLALTDLCQVIFGLNEFIYEN